MSSRQFGRLPKDPLDELLLDVSWIRVYILLRAASQRVAAADLVADLAGVGFECEQAFLSEIMRALERKGYLARIATPNGRRSDSVYVLTVEGRYATRGLKTKVRELLADIRPSGTSGVSAAS
jgi:DNA-binding MarR family transcriptional regulator